MKTILIIQNKIPHYRKSLYNELSKHYDVTILHSGGKSVGKDDKYKEIVTPLRRMGPFVLQSGVLREMRTGQYDAVVVMCDLHWIANIMAVLFKKTTRFLYWGHRYSKNRLANRVREIIMRMADGVILYSDSEIDRMILRGMPKSNIFVAPNTIDVPNHSDGSSCCKDSFIFVGRAQKRKAVDVLIRAFSEILDRVPENVNINIVGSGAENDNLKTIAKNFNVSDRVIFYGEIVEDEKLKPMFQRAFAYVSPGPVGLGVLHCFAYGTPVVTGRAGKHGPEFDNISNHYNSLAYESYDEFKEMLVNLCNDKTLSATLGTAAYELYVKERTLQIMVNGFRDAIDNVREGN